MPKTFTQGYQEDQAQGTPIGDNLTGEEILGFDPATGSTSFGLKLLQAKFWLSGFFTDKSYENKVDTNTSNIATNTSDVSTNSDALTTKMDFIGAVTENNILVQDVNGNAKDSGASLIVMQFNTVTDIFQWYNNTHTDTLHGLSGVPTMIHLQVKLRVAVAGWNIGETIETAFGNIGNELVGSILGITTTSSTFKLQQSSGGTAKCFAIPHKALSDSPYMAEESEIALDITFVRLSQ